MPFNHNHGQNGGPQSHFPFLSAFPITFTTDLSRRRMPLGPPFLSIFCCHPYHTATHSSSSFHPTPHPLWPIPHLHSHLPSTPAVAHPSPLFSSYLYTHCHPPRSPLSPHAQIYCLPFLIPPLALSPVQCSLIHSHPPSHSSPAPSPTPSLLSPSSLS